MNELIKMNDSKAYCWVLEGNPTIKFYEKSGAVFNGMEKPLEIGGKKEKSSPLLDAGKGFWETGPTDGLGVIKSKKADIYARVSISIGNRSPSFVEYFVVHDPRWKM